MKNILLPIKFFKYSIRVRFEAKSSLAMASRIGKGYHQGWQSGLSDSGRVGFRSKKIGFWTFWGSERVKQKFYIFFLFFQNYQFTIFFYFFKITNLLLDFGSRFRHILYIPFDPARPTRLPALVYSLKYIISLDFYVLRPQNGPKFYHFWCF